MDIFGILQAFTGCVPAMDAWAAVAGLVLSALGTVASGIGSAAGNNKQQRQLDEERARQEAWYNKEMYQDPLKRSDNAAMIRLMEDRIKEQERTDEAKQKVLGGTTEARLANRDSNNRAYAGMVSNMAAMASRRMDSLSAQKNQALSGFAQQQAKIDEKRMENWGNLASNAANLASNALTGIGGKKQNKVDVGKVAEIAEGHGRAMATMDNTLKKIGDMDFGVDFGANVGKSMF